MSRLGRAVAALDNFLEKVANKNKPLESLWATDEHKTFEDRLAKGIRAQAKWAADRLKEVDESIIPDDLEPLMGNQETKLRAYIDRFMPKISDYVSEDKVYEYLKFAFEWSVKAQYQRWGLVVKAADAFDFEVTNTNYIAALKNQANYLLNKSKINDTTVERLTNVISAGKLDSLTIDEIATKITSEFDDIADTRAFTIARTETAQAMGTANHATMTENGVQTKSWVTAGDNPCPICEGNEADGEIGVRDNFSSGVQHEPAHPNCECYTESGEIDLESVSVWDGS